MCYFTPSIDVLDSNNILQWGHENIIHSYALSLLFIIPVITMILNFFIKEMLASKISLIALSINLFISIYFTNLEFKGWNNISANFKINLWDWVSFNLDGLSIFYVLLTSILMLVCYILIIYIKTDEKLYLQCILFMTLLFNLVFTIQDIFGFYLFFEAMVIPMYILIGVWGSRYEKVKASYYFIVYTIGGSAILLLGILLTWAYTGTTSLPLLANIALPEQLENFLFLGFFLSFAAKIPLIPFHIWLPLAHVEAPVAGSVILAGLLIKLGTFGFIKFAFLLTPNSCIIFAPLIIVFSVISIIYASLSTIRQTDLKRVIAYSSVAHMGVATMSLFTLTALGVAASIVLQLAHGLVSSALFILVTILYNHHHTRSIPYYSGVAISMPLFATAFVFFSLCNIGIPLTGNFVGEFLSLMAGFNYGPWLAAVSLTGIVLSACYALFLVSRVCYGKASMYLTELKDMNRIETVIMISFTVLILIMGIFPNLLLDIIIPDLILPSPRTTPALANVFETFPNILNLNYKSSSGN